MVTMYKVLIVDDEKIIREGMAGAIEWDELNLKLAGAVSNGMEGLIQLRNGDIDIAIVDIKMPVMDGIAMIEKVREEGIQTEFIIISGYDDFEYAHRAMGNGVKYFLLKPTQPQEITDALKDIIAQIGRKEKAVYIENKYKESAEKLKKLMKEQFLRDCILGRVYSDEEEKYYLENLEMDEKNFSAVALQVNIKTSPENIFFVRSIAEEYFGECLFVCAIIDDLVYFVIDSQQEKDLILYVQGLLDALKDAGYYGLAATYCTKWDMTSPQKSSNEMETCLRCKFWVPDAEIITRSDVDFPKDERQTFVFHSQTLINSIRCGGFDEARAELNSFFEMLVKQKSSIEAAKFYSIRLYAELLGICTDSPKTYTDAASDILKMETLAQIRDYTVSFALSITEKNLTQLKKRSNKKIDKMVECIEENLSNEQLSLKWLSSNLLYFNCDYLGKLFKKEMGVSFTNYVVKKRIELACKLFCEDPQLHIYDVAEKTGFGDNTQYFSQVFKKEMGILPSDYQKTL